MIIHGDSLVELKNIPDESVDLVCTDPPYGYSFMGKSWDKTLPDIGIFKECLRVLKPGAFAFVMSAPRSDVCARMMLMLEDAGFEIGFTPIYWTYASGFPKAMNVGKLVDKRRWGAKVDEIRHYLRDIIKASPLTHQAIKQHLGYDSKSGVISNWTVTDSGASVPSGKDWLKLKEILPLDDRYDDLILEVEREVIDRRPMTIGIGGASERMGAEKVIDKPATPQAKALDGSYGGFQPKPAVEVVIVAMKPLSEKTYVDQALKNGKGVTWLDDCRVPTVDAIPQVPQPSSKGGIMGANDGRNGESYDPTRGRFPANLLVSDDVLNDGRVIKSTGPREHDWREQNNNNPTRLTRNINSGAHPNDSGSYSRYFDLDAWSKTLPFLIVPKASKGEKNRGGVNCTHPTVKPLKLMSYLITLGSREGDTVLEPFAGSGTTCVAAKELNRNFIGIEREAEYVEIARARVEAVRPTLL